MKQVFIPVLLMLLSSCSTSHYYQVFNTKVEKGKILDAEILFEDENCSVSYNLWEDQGGHTGFLFYNKTDQDLTIDLKKTFFVLNGIAYAYFQNRTYTNSSTKGTELSRYGYPYYFNLGFARKNINSSTFSVSYEERQELCVPPKTAIKLGGNRVAQERYKSCDLDKTPSGRDIKSLDFNKENSPFVFYNLITYSTKQDTFRIENRFHVDRIANYPSRNMLEKVEVVKCGKKMGYSVSTFRSGTPTEFYIKYNTNQTPSSR